MISIGKILSATTTAFWLAILIPIFLWGAGYIAFAGTIANMMEPKEIYKTDAIIALTGGTNRVTRALDLFAEGKSPRLFISGVNKDVKLSELLKLWDYQGKKLPKCCIDLGYIAGNTLENAAETREWVHSQNAITVRLITANYHMPRALLEFHHAIPEAQIVPHPVLPEELSVRDKKFWELTFLEYNKFLLSFVRVLFYPTETNPVLPALRKPS